MFMNKMRNHRRVGPHPGVTMTSAVVVLSAAYVVAIAGSPAGSAAGLLLGRAPLGAASAAASWSGFLTMGAAAPLLVSSAVFAQRQQHLGIRVPGPTIGLLGGAAAALVLLLSGAIAWTLGQPGIGAAGREALAPLGDALGGVGLALGMGLFAAGIAVPCLVLRLTPRWFAWVGLALAALAMLSWFSLVAGPLSWLLLPGRCGTLLWVLAAGFLLPRSRRDVAGRGPGRNRGPEHAPGPQRPVRPRP